MSAGPAAGRTLERGQRFVVHWGIIVAGVALSFYIDAHYHVGKLRSVALPLAPIFLLAATGWPWWLYETVRRARWFGLIRNDTAMRVILAVIAGFLILIGAGALSAQ